MVSHLQAFASSSLCWWNSILCFYLEYHIVLTNATCSFVSFSPRIKLQIIQLARVLENIQLSTDLLWLVAVTKHRNRHMHHWSARSIVLMAFQCFVRDSLTILRRINICIKQIFIHSNFTYLSYCIWWNMFKLRKFMWPS